MSETTLSVIIVSFNVRDFLYQTLHSIQRSLRGIPAEIIVVDNASWDGSVTMLQKDFPSVTLIANKSNLGFAKANNLAIEKSRGKYLVFINPDTIVQEDTFKTLLDFYTNHPEAGMIGCKILNPDGSLQLACRRSIPTPWVGFTKLVGLSKLFPNSKIFGKYNLTYLNPNQITEVEAISGSFMMTQRSVIDQVEYFDERFFMFGEDLDMCHRIRIAGWKIYYVPTTQIIHYKGTSSKTAQFDTLLQFYRAMLLFVQKHFKGKNLFLPQWVLAIGIGMRGLLSFVHNFVSRIKYAIIDLILLNLALIIAIYVRFGSLVHWKPYLLVTVIYSIVWLAVFYFFEVYSSKKFSAVNAMSAVLVGLGLNSIITYFAQSFAFSRIVVLVAGVLNLLFIPGWRWILFNLARTSRFSLFDRIKNRMIEKRTMIVGDGKSVSTLVKKLKQQYLGGSEIVALLLTDSNTTSLNGAANLPVLCDLEYLPRHIRELQVNEVIFGSDSLAYEKILGLMSQSQELGIEFKIVSNNMGVLIGAESLDNLGEFSLVGIHYRLLKPGYRFLKRVMDWTIALPVLVCSLPLWPILLLNGNRLRKFPIFTNMRAHKSYSSGIMPKRDIVDEKNGPMYVIAFSKKDAIPKSRLQKLPILFYVLKGDLSLVGGRFQFKEELVLPIKNTINLKPGLVAIYQVEKENQISTEAEENLAVQYLRNYSPLLDIQILLKSTARRN